MSDTTDCPFCEAFKTPTSGLVLVTEDLAFAKLDSMPATHFHTLIMPTTHRSSLLDVTPEELLAMSGLAHRIARVYQELFDPPGFNILLNSGELAGQKVMHAHMHLIPRYRGDGLDLSHTKPESTHGDLEAEASSLRRSFA